MRWLKNVLTLGAYGRVEDRKKSYERNYAQLEKVLHKFDQANENAQVKVYFLIYTRQQSLKLMQKIHNDCNALIAALNQDQAFDKYLTTISVLEEKPTIDVESITKETIEQIPIAAAIGLSAGNALLAVGKVLAATGTTKLGVMTLGSFKGALISATAVKGSAATVGFAKGSVVMAKLGLMAIGTKAGSIAASSLLGAAVFPFAVLVAGFYSHWKADQQIERIREEERKVIALIKEYSDLTLRCEVLEKRSSEISNSLKNVIEETTIIYRRFKRMTAWAKFFKRIRSFLRFSPITKKMKLKIETQTALLVEKLQILYQLTTVKIKPI